ncbi:SusC/RagA family TonB-linked outer membrane protein [Lentimicrobium sp. L6]|uniref:SusC/RagA family TonB-linked outer membrane protein n=1 Tax=Lentimicrobium sp. L6 TaxID=2735916 RepID=UPI00155197CD|nr:SusC/RagA family TonB-linked outer membrane protein [Lentimicrobium sp. L6]NPD84546.1 SusC/RagA family TonB-linked outer membrane protein [Lentimicrobium sp. L6]
MMFKRVFIITLFLWSFLANAQVEVSGIVISDEDQKPVPFVNIIGLQSRLGGSSDMDGQFSISVSDSETHLIFSAIGFQQDTIILTASPMNISLHSMSLNLDEVVVTALGIKREKKSLGYAMTEVKGEDLVKSNDVSVINKLSGKVAGLKITSTNGGAGTSSRIILRGNNSITGDNQALIVVDGVPINNSTNSNSGAEWGGRDYGNGVSDINADDIESISVLKGASASALYGSQAMDGVILITTKKGKAGKKIGVSFSSNTSIDQAYILYDLQNTYGAGRNGKFEGAWDINANGTPVFNPSYDFSKGSWGPKMEGQTIVDWDGNEKSFSPQEDNYKNYFEPGVTTNNSIGIDGGFKNMTYRFSVANIATKDIIPGLTYNRTNVGLNISASILKKIKLNSYFNYVNSKVNDRPGLSDAHDNPNRNYIHMPRHISSSSLSDHYINPDGTENTWYQNWSWMTNPYWNKQYQKNEDVRNRYFGHISLQYDFNENLKLMVRAAPDVSKTKYSSIDAQKGLIYGLGRYSESNNDQYLINSDFLATYSNDWKETIMYSVNIGGNAMYYKAENESANTEGGLVEAYVYTLENSLNPIYYRNYLTEAAKNSLYAFAQINYKHFLYLDITARNDWSSTLPKNDNSFFYPSISLGFVFSELLNEDKINKDIFSFGKLRASYAGVGNDADPYQLETTYEIIDNEGYDDMAFIDRTVPNLGLLPELVNSLEAGLELKFFMNRLGLDATYYNTRSHNQITNMPVSAASGYYTAIVNSGIIENKGWEVQLNASPVKNNKFQWDLNFAYSKNNSQIIELAPNVERATLYEHWRLTVEARPDNPYGDIVGYGYKRDESGIVLIDKNGMVVRDETPKVLGNFTPDFGLSLSSTFRFQNWSLSFLIDSQIGGDMFSGTNMYGYGYSGNFEETLEGREAWYQSEAAREEAGVSSEDWTATGGYLVEGVYEPGTIINGEDMSGKTNSTYIDPYQYYQKVSMWQEEIHESFIYDASFVKLRELSISYSIPKDKLEKVWIKGLTAGVFANNVWLIYSEVPNVDPESMLTNGNGQGYELYSYPNKRSIGVSISVNF